MLGRTNAGGGGGLNFRVIGGTSAPSSPKENDIWVNTDVKIASYIFSVTEPENPVEGMVWIPTGTSSPVAFNALKKNGIQVYPISAKQYVSGAWVDVTAKSYQNGEWVDWAIYLYRSGNEFTEITGGWALSQNYSGSRGDSLIKSTDSMVFSSSYVSGEHFASGFLRANNKILLSKVSTLVAVLEDVSISNNVPIALCIAKNDTPSQYNNAVAKTDIKTGDTMVVLDVSSAGSDLLYIGLTAADGENNGESRVTLKGIYYLY